MTARPDLQPENNTEALRTILKSQYHASLAMLRESIDLCPEDLWYSEEPENAFWQVAYHALFFTHLYLMPNPEAYEGWEGHQPDVQNPDGIAAPPDPESSLPLIPRPYTKDEALAYWQVCSDLVGPAVDGADIWSEESGFSWYPIPKLEHQIVNLRHVQHHTAQLADRLRSAAGIGVRWASARRKR